jgi:hypothetical protein
MLIRMLVGLSGSHYTLGPGDERDFPQDEAIRLVSAGFAVPTAEQNTETAERKPVAERRTQKKAAG